MTGVPADHLRAEPDAAGAAPASLDSILAELRRLAIAALDGGHPLAAARIAGTADQVEAAILPSWPSRPGYGSPSPKALSDQAESA